MTTSLAPATPEEKAKAREIVERSGIPLQQAMLVVRGRHSLNDVLKEMLARQRRAQLVDEGMELSLAGQVARGRLPHEKAVLVQKVHDVQGASFHSQEMKCLVGKEHMAMCMFGRGMIGGQVSGVSRYTITLKPEGGGDPVELKKHDIKLYCHEKNAADILPHIGTDARVASMKLSSTTDLRERFRPTEELAVEWVGKRRLLRFLFRDGEVLSGRPTRVSFFEIDLEVKDGKSVTMLTHGLYKPRPYQLLEVEDE